jgi:hypothetical protein
MSCTRFPIDIVILVFGCKLHSVVEAQAVPYNIKNDQLTLLHYWNIQNTSCDNFPKTIFSVLKHQFLNSCWVWYRHLKERMSSILKWHCSDKSYKISIYTSNKVMQVCLITALIVKRYKRENYLFVIIFT